MRKLTRVVAVLIAVGVGSAPPAAAQPPPAAAARWTAAPGQRGPANAPIVILLFSDFQCPYCARVGAVLDEVQRALPTEVQIVFKHHPLPIHPQAPLAHEAAIEAGRQGRFWEMHDLLFADQRSLDRDSLVARAVKLGLDVDAFRQALDDGRHRPVVDRELAESRALAVSGTPSMFVNGRRLVGVPSAPALIAQIRQTLDGSASTPDAPLGASAFDLTGSPARGPDGASVTIVEYSDLRCPFSARVYPELSALAQRYAGRVRWVFKNFPLSIHPDAPLAHRAALAAGEQGRFWDMRDAIFKNEASRTREALVELARGLGLDLPRFEADLVSDRLGRVLERDQAEGIRLGVDGTPTLFINGRRMTGAKPAAVIGDAIERALRLAENSSAPAGAIARQLARGREDARVVIEWFADLSSPVHREASALMRRVLDAYQQDVRVSFRHRPLEGRAEGLWLHELAMAGAAQGRFWEVLDLITRRPDLRDPAAIARSAAAVGIDGPELLASLADHRHRPAVERDAAQATALGIRGTPTFVVNGVRIDGVVSFEEIERAVAQAMGASSRQAVR